MDELLKRKLSEYFAIERHPEKAFTRILNFSLDETENMTGKISAADFFEAFFVLTPNNDRKAEIIIENLLKGGHRFIFLHGYAKNGKTTFSYYLNHRIQNQTQNQNLEIIIHRFDFNIQDPRNGNVKLNLTFLDAVKEWLLLALNIDNNIDVLKDIIAFHSFIEKNQMPIDENTINPNVINNGNNMFDNVSNRLDALVKQTKARYDQRFVDYKKVFEKQLEGILNDFTDKDCSDILTYLIFLKLYSKLRVRDQAEHSKKKLILFVFDNIDDILAPAAINIQGNYILELIFQIIIFRDIFGSAFNNETNGFDVAEDLRFLFQFRSANLVNAIIQREDSPASRTDRFLEYTSSPVYTVSAINFSTEILKRRFHIYEQLMDYQKKPIPKRVSFFKQLFAEEFKGYQENRIKINKLLKIWNGNRAMALMHFPFDKFDNIDFPADRKYQYLLLGTMLNVFLTPYYDDPELYPSLRLFLKANNEKLCNLPRLILTLIYNRTQYNRRFSRIESMRSKGMPLYDILVKLYAFKNKEGVHVYSKEMIKQAFSQMFDGQIDDWKELITCTKTTIHTQNEVSMQGKHINISPEIESFYKEYKGQGDNEKLIHSLRNVRLFYNDSADYLITEVITSFEYICLFEVGKTCLLFQIWEQLEKNNIEYFLEKIRLAFAVVEEITTDSVNHYINDFSSLYNPTQYCDSEFATKRKLSGSPIKGKFMFDLMISRHVTYLDQFRHYILNKENNDGSPKIKNQGLKIDINKNMIAMLETYISLFIELYDKIVSANLEPSDTLEATRASFTGTVAEKIKMIKDSDYTDFSSLGTDKN